MESLLKKCEAKAKTFPDMIEENSQCCKDFGRNCCDCTAICGIEKWVSVGDLRSVLEDKSFVVVPRAKLSEISNKLYEMAFGKGYHPRQEREQEICDNIVKLKLLLEGTEVGQSGRARKPHKLEVDGSNPSLCTNSSSGHSSAKDFEPHFLSVAEARHKLKEVSK